MHALNWGGGSVGFVNHGVPTMPTRKRKAAPKLPVQRDLASLASRAVERAVRRGVTNIDDLYLRAERGANRSLVNIYNSMTPRIIRNHTAAGRRLVSRAANIQRKQRGMLHQYLVAAVLSRVAHTADAAVTKGDLIVNGQLVECKRSMRERRRQIFADGNKVNAVIVRSFDRGDETPSIFKYLKDHNAALVVPGGHPKAITMTEYVARLKHSATNSVKVAA